MKDKDIITKDDILKMSEAEYMNDVQLNFFKELLISQKQEIEELILDTKKDLSECEKNSDLSDTASVQENQQFYLQSIDRNYNLLKKIEQSLRRIETKEYGYCLETGDPIGIARLLARPTASLSIDAKEIYEHKKKTQGSFKNKDED